MKARLYRLLEQFRTASEENRPEVLEGFAPSSAARDGRWMAELECAAKAINYEIAAAKTDSSLHESITLLDAMLFLSEQDVCDAMLPLVLAEELLECHTIERCKVIFEYLEQRVDRLTQNISGTKGKGLVLLRLCNELLRRLSKTEDAVFCGRILIFLSKSFPLSEKSGLNTKGDFNVDNITRFETDLASANELDRLYPVFWTLQEFFSSPLQLLDTPGRFATFQLSLRQVLDKLKAMEEAEQKIPPRATFPEAQPGEKRKREALSSLKRFFSPKFLSSRNLFDLELADINFRRHILVQVYILFDYLNLFTEKIRSKTAVNINRTLLPDLKLTPEQEKWVSDTRVVVAHILCLRTNEGRLFLRSMQAVLLRDKNWVHWKQEGCQAFVQPAAVLSRMEDARRRLTSSNGVRPDYRHAMGTYALSQIWEQGLFHGLQDLQEESRWKIPDAHDFEAGVKADQVDIDAPLSDSDRDRAIDARASKTWRAFRSASLLSGKLFRMVESGELSHLYKTEDAAGTQSNTELDQPNGPDNDDVDITPAPEDVGDKNMLDNELSPTHEANAEGELLNSVPTTTAEPITDPAKVGSIDEKEEEGDDSGMATVNHEVTQEPNLTDPHPINEAAMMDAPNNIAEEGAEASEE